MSDQIKKKVKKFGPKKTSPTISQSSKKKAQVPISQGKMNNPPPATPVPIPEGPQSAPVPQAISPAPTPVPVPQPVQPTPLAPPATQPTPIPAPTPLPPQPIPKGSGSDQPPLPPIIPMQEAKAATPPSIDLKTNQETVNAPTHVQPAMKPLESKKETLENTSQGKVLKGKPVNQSESEDLKDEVASYLEVCDSCLSENNSPKDIIDVLHMLVRSLNFDVVTIALLDDKKENLISEIASRGYNNPPTMSVVNCWEKAIVRGKGLDWKVLMKVAGDNQIDLTYWIVQEGLDSIGYVPIRDSQTIYGFIFVAAMEKKTQSPLSSLLLDACGSRIGIANSINANKGDWPEVVLSLAKDIRNQLSLLMGYIEMLRETSLTPDQISEIVENCNKTIIKSTQMLDSMTSEALGD